MNQRLDQPDRFVFSGNSTFTIESPKTGTRFTYQVRKAPKCKKNSPVYFVRVLTGADNERDYSYIGIVTSGQFMRTAKSRLSPDAPSLKAFKWFVAHAINKTIPKELAVYHEGRCGRCGRKLTVPESIKSGFGPDCINKL